MIRRKMETEFKKLNKDQYRNFDNWIRENNRELYENKVSYEVRWGKDEFFYVKLCDESFVSFDDILLAINK
jgi:hypothetical protein|tara:strand:+ start:2077 stop:2289 length:213 start_codon:yes stop_codon:yes gene_type:complete